jgi:peptide chain release factor subunit 1
MPADAKARYQFRRMLEELEGKRGRGTELISVYITPDFDLAKVLQQLREEQGTAANIKSKSTRKNVQGALERIIQFLQAYMRSNRKPPPNGMAIFAGNVAEREDYVDIRLYWIEPPEVVPVRLYRCDQEFVLGPLKEMLEIKETVGVLAMNGKEATFATVRGKNINIERRLTSGVPSKHSKGGQSARRFERLREIAIHEYHKRVAETATSIFTNIPDLRGIIIGGPGPTKEDFLREELLHPDLRRKILAVIDTGYADEQGIKEIVNKAGEVLGELEIMREKSLVQRFLRELVTGSGLAIYGDEPVKRALEQGVVETLLISESYGETLVRLRCQACTHELDHRTKNFRLFQRQLQAKECPACRERKLVVLESRDLVQEMLERAEKVGTRAEFISTQTEEGKQLELAFNGLAAMLRYRVD